ncbi:type II toxin-antitoxin system death-on-curing family toxin [Mycoplasma enhydrae]|uniref:type II toxin-antitoxin system death-on-curing family toxin n=1 Tax=Mycoplasma enhydrae TaxID=2499220 RepID=UPI00197C6B90|nr:type II toxin-antitoxin system death-on-curing family toxin [Mycoplasma enhydrae]MBN4089317.1 type II toxin-antitoxin system death-on-curing family toxin [Mycoplasma enhydrae]
MKKTNIILSKLDSENLNDFICRYVVQEKLDEKNKKTFKSISEIDIEKISKDFNLSILDLSNEEIMDKFLYSLENQLIPRAFETAKKIDKLSEDTHDFLLVNPKESVIDILIRRLNKFYYSQDWSIIDLATELFICFLSDHHFFNGNKRFAISFLKTLLFHFGFYFQWNETNPIWGQIQSNDADIEEQIACFEIRLSNRTIDPNSNDEHAEIIKKNSPRCFDILSKDSRDIIERKAKADRIFKNEFKFKIWL